MTYTSYSDGNKFLGFEKRNSDLAATAYAPLCDRHYIEISMSDPSSVDTDFIDSSSDDKVFTTAPSVQRWSADLANIHIQPCWGLHLVRVATLHLRTSWTSFICCFPRCCCRISWWKPTTTYWRHKGPVAGVWMPAGFLWLSQNSMRILACTSSCLCATSQHLGLLEPGLAVPQPFLLKRDVPGLLWQHQVIAAPCQDQYQPMMRAARAQQAGTCSPCPRYGAGPVPV